MYVGIFFCMFHYMPSFMVLLGIPEDITTENIETTLAKPNPELDIKEGDIRAKFSYNTKRETKNLVIEVDSGTRKKLIKKSKAVLLQAWSGPEGSRKLRFPDFMTTAQDGGKFVSLTHRPHLPPGNTPGTHFC